MMDIKKTIIDEITTYEWDNEDKVIASIIPNIIFTVDKFESKQDLLKSRFGGEPAVPKDFIWPLQNYKGNAPLAFFFQLNFEDIHPFDTEHTLPKKGILLCFASVTGDIMWDYNAKDAFEIYYFPNTNELTALKIPENLPSEQKLSPRNITFSTSYQLPRYPYTHKIEDLSKDDIDGIEQVGNEMFNKSIGAQHNIKMIENLNIPMPLPKDPFPNTFSYNMLLGDPVSVQHTVAEEWSELYFGEEHSFEYSETFNYVNLISFEMKGDEGYGFSSNGAHLYLCMHKEDLKNNNFEKIISIIQNT